MQTLKQFQKLNPELELVKNDTMHKELHSIEPSWYIFINRERGVVEIHDTQILDGNIEMDTHIMTEQFVTQKIVHDALKYNSRVHDAAAWFAEQDRITEEREKQKQLKRKLIIRESVRKALYE